jgi:hypothetical protein
MDAMALASLNSQAQQAAYYVRLTGKPVAPSLRQIVTLVGASLR